MEPKRGPAWTSIVTRCSGTSQSLVALFDRSFPSVLADELRRVVERIEQHVG